VLVFCREPNPEPRELAFRTLIPDVAAAAAPRRAAPDPSARPTVTPGRRGSLLATTAPGMNATVFPKGAAMLVKAGSVLTFQMHYTTNGEATSDRSSIGFVFAKQAPEVEVRASAFTNGRLVIPAGAPDHAVESGVSFNYDVTLYSIFPHTHVRGKSWDYKLTYPDGRSETLLSVPKYDFNWQTDYVFEKAAAAPAGHAAEGRRALRQLGAQSLEPGPQGRSALGRADVGRDAVHRHQLQHRQEARPPTTASVR
jgi:hypothetical protein